MFAVIFPASLGARPSGKSTEKYAHLLGRQYAPCFLARVFRIKAAAFAARSIRTAGEPSARHLFGPTAAPELPRKAAVVSLAPLTKILSAYLKKSEIEAVEAAFQFSDQAHLSQYRQSGEP